MNDMADRFVICGTKVHSETGAPETGGVIVEGGVIKKVFSTEFKCSTDGARVITFPNTYHLIPGMIDMHVHGAGGSDVMDGSAEALTVISGSLIKEGVTSFLASTMSAESDLIGKALKNVRDHAGRSVEMPGAEVIGVHLEGPFISSKYAGAHRRECVKFPDVELFDDWQDMSGGMVKLVTLAPELPGSIEFISYLKRNNVIASVGHTDADRDTVSAAIAAGASHATHLFNAMRGFHHREPGAAGALLVDERITAELIADGIHLDPQTLELAYHVKGSGKIVLVSDSIRAKYQGDGIFDLDGRKVLVKDGEVRLDNGTLAGSVLKLKDAIKNMITFSGCSIADAIKMIAENPAKELGIFVRKGSIAEGKDADLVVLDDGYEVVMTVCGGRIVYQAS